MIFSALSILLTACARPPEPPDVVVFVVDTLRADHLALHGHERPTSPNLDRFATESVVFDRALASSGWTLPSVGSILTGRLPSEHGARRDPVDPLKMNRLDPSVPTLPETLQGAGYRTAAFINNVFLAPEFGFRTIFEHFDYDGATSWNERSAQDTVDLSLKWLAAADQPAFVYIHVMEPHLPYLPPRAIRRRFSGGGPSPVILPFADAGEIEAYQRRAKVLDAEQIAYVHKLYDEEILAADEAFGRLVAGLRARPRWDRTVVVFTSDHGEEFFEHGGFEHGHSLHGELLRVPLVIRGLDLEAPHPEDRERRRIARDLFRRVVKAGARGRRFAQQVQLLDLMPTLLAVTGVPAPEGMLGVDLRPLVAGDPEGPRSAVAEDCLYGPSQIGITSDDLRLTINQDTRIIHVWNLDPFGQGDRILGVDEATAVVQPLLDALEAQRGDLEKHTGTRLTANIDEENMEKLRELGYVQ